MSKAYDVIVVGARCAGSPTGMLLARNGYDVLLVDRATFPSDMMSTHLIHPPGVAALKRWGVLEQLRATGCPPMTTYAYDMGPIVITGSPRLAFHFEIPHSSHAFVLTPIRSRRAFRWLRFRSPVTSMPSGIPTGRDTMSPRWRAAFHD
jgi:2-polyprenyl-6-methoxyphenol hydroxylase-like FAD-dependent oxidoreductase